jgi:predicted RNase H-like HicB family nuclease
MIFMSIRISVMVSKENDWYVAKCIENSVASQGNTIDEALSNLKEAIELYYEDEKPNIEDKQVFLTTMEVAI